MRTKSVVLVALITLAGCGGGGSGSSGSSADGSGSGGAGSGGAGAPASSGGLSIVSFTASPPRLTPGATTMISAIVTDDGGLSAIAGGNLVDGSGAALGALTGAGGQGTFARSLSWSDLEAAAAINLPAHGGARALTATFFDNAGHRVQSTLQLGLGCSDDGNAVCDGACVDLASSSDACGMCGVKVPAGEICKSGAIGCATAGATPCGNGCFDLTSNVDNCGACGHSCGDYAVAHGLARDAMTCTAGACVYAPPIEPSASISTCAQYCGKWSLTCTSGSFQCDERQQTGFGCATYGLQTACYADIVLTRCDQPTATYTNADASCSMIPRQMLQCLCK